MARKKLLTESEIRRFMKLASMSPVGEEKIQEYGMDYPGLREDEEEVGLEAEVEEIPGEEMPMDEPMDEPLEEPLEEPMDETVDVEGAQTVSLDDFMSAFESALEDVTGETVSTELDLGAEEEEVEAPLEGGDLDELPAEMPHEEDVEEFPGGRDMYENQDALVNEVAKRVAARLAKEHKKTEMIDTLTERIFERLTSKKVVD